jgi:membrane protein YdbS with pleckstrin-like domain
VNGQQHPDEADKFRAVRRWILILVVLYIPVLASGFALNRLLHSELPATLFVIVLFASLIYLSIRAFVLHYRLTGKYPFYWLRK